MSAPIGRAKGPLFFPSPRLESDLRRDPNIGFEAQRQEFLAPTPRLFYFKQAQPVPVRLAQELPRRTPVLTEVEIASGQRLPESSRQSDDAPTRVLATLAHLERNLQPSQYTHSRRVDLESGIVRCDCSQLVGAILAASAPLAASEAPGLAASIFRGIRRVDPAQPSAGWQRIARIADLRPGDVIAWPTPPGLPSRVSGHVVIAIGSPQAYRNGYLVRIADSTSLPHGEDSRAGGSGYGYGTMYFEVDPSSGEGIGYGWAGRYSTNYVLRTPIAVGRPRGAAGVTP